MTAAGIGRLLRLLRLGAVVALSGAVAEAGADPLCAARLCTFRIVNQYPHDPGAFTQGLVVDAGTLIEGTGLRGRSTLRRVDIATGAVLQSLSLPAPFFGEGVTVFDERIVQLTWQSGIGLVFDRESFAPRGRFRYATEGWGLTHDGRRLIMSDGTATLHFLDPRTFALLERLTVRGENGPVERLNELEYVEGEIYANVWQSDFIARISPRTGEVLGWIDLRGLLALRPAPGVLNGIAYDPAHGRLFVTGKNWPLLFEIALEPAPPGS